MKIHKLIFLIILLTGCQLKNGDKAIQEQTKETRTQGIELDPKLIKDFYKSPDNSVTKFVKTAEFKTDLDENGKADIIPLNTVQDIGEDPGDFHQITIELAFVGLPVLTFSTIGQAYDKNKHFSEKIEFLIEEDKLELIGQTFRSTFNWEQITKIKETDNYFTLHQGRALLTMINKDSYSKETVDKLRQFFKEKKKLK